MDQFSYKQGWMLRFWVQHLLDKCFAYQLKKQKKQKKGWFNYYLCTYENDNCPNLQSKLNWRFFSTHTHKNVKLEVEILVVNVFWIPMACGMIYVLTCAAERGKSIFSSNYVLPSSDYWAPSMYLCTGHLCKSTNLLDALIRNWVAIYPHNTISLQRSYFRSITCNNMDTKLEQVKIISK